MQEIRVGFIGTGWISRVHAHALRTLDHIRPLNVPIRLVAVCGRNPERTEAFAQEFGFERTESDWQALVESEDIDVIANLGTNALHIVASKAAIRAGKHVFVEKPLSMDASDAQELQSLCETSDVRAVVGFNFRFMSGIRMLHELIHSGQLGEIRHYRSVYLQDWLSENPNWPNHGGAGALADYSHAIDTLLHLVGEPISVSAQTSSFLSNSDDAFQAIFSLHGGATATVEASRVASGRKNHFTVEVNGTEGSAYWNAEDQNRLHLYVPGDDPRHAGFTSIFLTEDSHPFQEGWWPAGHQLGWDASFVHEWRAFLESVLDGSPTDHLQATIKDGLHVALLSELIYTSAETGQRLPVELGASIQSSLQAQ